jgi:hypothetical protein
MNHVVEKNMTKVIHSSRSVMVDMILDTQYEMNGR